MTIAEMAALKDRYAFSYAYIEKISGVPAPTVQKVLTGETSRPRQKTLEALESAFTYLKSQAEGKSVIKEVKYSFDKMKNNQTGVLYDTGEIYAAGRTQVAEPQAAYQVRKKGPGDYTIEDYYALPDDVRMELIDGVFYDIGAPTGSHQFIAGEAYRQIANFIMARGGKCRTYISPVDVQLDQDDKTMVQPDVIIVCNPSIRKLRVVYGAPDFIIEVISKTTRKKDYTKKLQKYADAGVREYWIVDPFTETVFVYYFEDEKMVRMYPLYADIPVQIYEGELTICFEPIREWIEELQEETEEKRAE